MKPLYILFGLTRHSPAPPWARGPGAARSHHPPRPRTPQAPYQPLDQPQLACFHWDGHPSFSRLSPRPPAPLGVTRRAHTLTGALAGPRDRFTLQPRIEGRRPREATSRPGPRSRGQHPHPWTGCNSQDTHARGKRTEKSTPFTKPHPYHEASIGTDTHHFRALFAPPAGTTRRDAAHSHTDRRALRPSRPLRTSTGLTRPSLAPPGPAIRGPREATTRPGPGSRGQHPRP